MFVKIILTMQGFSNKGIYVLTIFYNTPFVLILKV